MIRIAPSDCFLTLQAALGLTVISQTALMTSRRRFLELGAATAALAACQPSVNAPSNSPSANAPSPVKTTASGGKDASKLRVGFQPPYVAIYTLQQQKFLEQAFVSKSTEFEFRRMLSLKPVAEALSASAIDLGLGGTPIPAIASGLPIRVIALVERSPKTHAILVRPDSPIKSVVELKGKKVGTPQGKSHLLVLRALDKAGLKDTDIEWLQLENDVGRAALQQGSIDAWATWDPFYAGAEVAKEAVPIVDGDGYVSNFVAIFGRSKFLDQYPDTVQQFLKSYQEAVNWVNANREAARDILVKENKLVPEAAQLTLSRRNILLKAPNDEYRKDGEAQSKLFVRLKLAKQEINWDQVIDTRFANAIGA